MRAEADPGAAHLVPVRQVTGEKLIFWCLPAVAAMWVVAFLLFPGFVPPMSPTASATEVADFYRDNSSRVQWSMILFNWFGVAMIPMVLLICERMRLMAHRTPVVRYCMIGVAGAAPIDMLTSTIFWLIAAFRPDRSPELVLLCNDLAWITFICGVPFLIGMCLFLALAIFYDGQSEPVFPRWIAWFNVAVAAALAPAAFAALTLSGPLAWDGFISFWVRNAALTMWIVVMAVALRQAMKRPYPSIEGAA